MLRSHIWVVAAVIGALLFAHFSNGGSVVKDSFLNSFFGAFCAFLFVRAGEGLTGLYKRAGKHHSALVRLELWHNELHSLLKDQEFVIKAMNKVFDRAVQSGEPAISA